MVIFPYIILVIFQRSHFLYLTDVMLFLQGAPFLYVHFQFCKYTLHVRYVIYVGSVGGEWVESLD